MKPDIPCAEGIAEYDVTWPWRRGPMPPGLTCVFRVRNEARNLPWVLPPMLRAVQRVVLVDNGSEDGTGDVGRQVAAAAGAADRYTGLAYPFRVSRAGAEHRATPAHSVHSLTHFYNWCFSQVSTAYSMKWDGDMVLTPEGEATLADLSWQLEGTETVVVVPRHPLTVVDERTGWLDLGMRFLEPWIYPMGPEFTFVKAFDWEVREWPERCERVVLPEGLCVELKWLDADEFAHWTDVGDFDNARAPRKRREWEVDRAIREGRAEQVAGLVRITAPPGVHIVDHVTRTWLPQQPRPLAAPTPRAGAGSPETAARKAAGGRDPLHRLEESAQPILALVHPDLEDVTARLPVGTTVVRLPVAALEQTGRWGTVVLLAPDRDALQRAVVTLPAVQAAKEFAVYLDYAHEVVPLVPRDDWERLVLVASRRDGNRFLNLARFTNWMNPRVVLAEYARQSVRHRLTPHQGLRIGVTGDALAPPAEVSALRLHSVEDAGDQARDVPPDVVVTAPGVAATLSEHHVTGRAPVLVSATAGPLDVGPLDERILNPRGFVTEAAEPDAELVLDNGLIALRGSGLALCSTPQRGATEEMVRALRARRGVTPRWPETGDTGYARAAAGLAMAGVPLVAHQVPRWARELLGPAVSDALAAPVDLADALAREEHSIVLRRAALREFSMPAWRARVAAVAGLRPPATPSVSVLMATRRADQLEHALAQVRRQRGLELELVLAPHGFTVDPRRVAELAGDHVRTLVVPHPAETLFGDVLAAAAEAASGDVVLKMDDDDWYGPDVVTDLLLAREYSGADLVGMPAEFLYLVPVDLTVRRNDRSEEHGRFVAGGTMLLDRALLRAVGSFRPVRRFVDASLLADVLAAGGTVYRTQGLGYLFRRDSTGHTWQADLDYFLDPQRLHGRWEGMHPSRLLELDRA